MKFMDKLKNIFFEEEEEEETEIKKEVKEKSKEKEVIVKKVEVPKREVIEQEEVEIKPVVETKVETEIPKKEIVKKEVKNQELIFDDDDFILDKPEVKKETTAYRGEKTSKTRENRDLYKKEEVKTDYNKTTSKVEYPSKEEVKKKNFTPSPIISPIYGILDKNYKKEEVKEKKEIRISTRPSKVDFDSVRNKAFGELENDIFPSFEKSEEKKAEETPRVTRRLYDMSGSKEKPVIEKVTIGEADEYFNDLGLAYNTDYKDISKEVSDGKVKEEKVEKKEKLEDNLFDLIEAMYDKEDK